MIRSGETLDLGAALGRKVVDKHSTGGVGDKTSIAVGPIVAACGVPLGKMSGRGLGHTGGTLDKLESIPGFRVELTTEELVAQLRDVGMAIVGQSGRPRAGRQEALRAARRDGDRRHRAADRVVDHVEEARRGRRRDRPRRQGRRRRVHEDARRRPGARRGDARARPARGQGGRRACSPTWTSRSAARSGTRSRSARRSTRCAARARRTSPSSCSTPARGCSRYSDLGIDVDGGPPARRGRRRRRDRARRPTSAGSGRRAATRARRAAGGARPASRCRRRATASSRGSARSPSASPRSSSAPAGGRRRTRSTTRSASLCFAKRGDAVLAGDDLAEVHARDDASAAAAAEAVLAAYAIGDERPGARHRARRHRLSATAATRAMGACESRRSH